MQTAGMLMECFQRRDHHFAPRGSRFETQALSDGRTKVRDIPGGRNVRGCVSSQKQLEDQ